MSLLEKVDAFYRARVFTRCDDTGRVKYFAPEDFPGLVATPYGFETKQGDTLSGWFYTYPEKLREGDDARLVIFAHGLGGGHRSYMKEIELLARHGYRVFAYDNTGCMLSGGERMRGLASSLSDLDDCLTALKADETVDTRDISVVGHSWGGFAAMNVTAFHPDVKRIVGFAGFVSVEQMAKQTFALGPEKFRQHFINIEREENPIYADISALDTLAKTEARVLLFHSHFDSYVSYGKHFKPMLKAFKDKENITMVSFRHKGHNPNYTAEAVAYKRTMNRALLHLPKVMTEDEKEAFRSSFDWDRMTEQDPVVWEMVFAHIDR